MEQKIMKPFDQYEIDWDIDFGTWDIDFGTWDIDTSLTETTNKDTFPKRKKGKLIIILFRNYLRIIRGIFKGS